MTSLNPVYTVGWQLAEAVLAHRDVAKEQAWARAVELLDLVGIPQRRGPGQGLPARVLRRHAPAGHDRHGDRQRPGRHHRRRADHRPRRHRPGPDPRDAASRIKDEHSARRSCSSPTTSAWWPAWSTGCWSCTPARSVESGTVDDVFYEPRMPYTVGLLGSIPRVGRRGRRQARCPIRGAPPSLINLPPGCPFSPRCPLARQDCREAEPDARPPPTSVEHLAACFHCRRDRRPRRSAELFAAPERCRDRHRRRRRRRPSPPTPPGPTRAARGHATWSSTSPIRGGGVHPPHRRRGAGRVGRVASTSTRARRSGWSASRAAASRPPAEPILQLHRPTSGSVRFEGDELTTLSNKQMRPRAARTCRSSSRTPTPR